MFLPVVARHISEFLTLGPNAARKKYTRKQRSNAHDDVDSCMLYKATQCVSRCFTGTGVPYGGILRQQKEAATLRYKEKEGTTKEGSILYQIRPLMVRVSDGWASE
jgi:hypothetical protein